MTTRILLIDDRPVRRQRVGTLLSDTPGLEVIGQLSSRLAMPPELFRNPPDIIAISEEVAQRCKSVLTRRGALGRVDAGSEPLAINGVRKLSENNGLQIIQYSDDLDFKGLIRRLKFQQGSHSVQSPENSLFKTRRGQKMFPIIVIGASTGGVEALTTVLQRFPKDCPPTLVVQHMKPAFVGRFAARMNDQCTADICEASNRAFLKVGQIYVAPGGRHLEIIRAGGGLQCRVFDGEPHGGHMPSVDVLFNSLANLRGPRVGALLTGMGRDGAEGMLKIKQSGGYTIGQDENSSVVYGMPRVAYEIGGVDIQLPLKNIGDAIIRSCRTLSAAEDGR